MPLPGAPIEGRCPRDHHAPRPSMYPVPSYPYPPRTVLPISAPYRPTQIMYPVPSYALPTRPLDLTLHKSCT
eukprot:2157137-Rhodomonas_salina.1